MYVNNKVTQLLPSFVSQVENFFCMGSPLAVFLALRGIRPGTSCHQDHILPTFICSRLFNVFHPTDPVVSLLDCPSTHTYIYIYICPFRLRPVTPCQDFLFLIIFDFSPSHTHFGGCFCFLSRNSLFLPDLPFSTALGERKPDLWNSLLELKWGILRIWQLERVRTFCFKLTEVVLICSGLQTGAPHPQTLQQCFTCSDTLVRTYIFLHLMLYLDAHRMFSEYACFEYLGFYFLRQV